MRSSLEVLQTVSNLASLALGLCSLPLRGRVGVRVPSCSLSLRERAVVRAPGGRFVLCAWVEAGAGASSRQPSHFLLLRQKKVTKEKATPLAATLRFATGNLRCSLFAGSAQTRLRLKHARPFFREKLRSSARPQGIWNPTRHGASLCGVRIGVSSGSLRTPPLAHTHTHTYTYEPMALCPHPNPLPEG